MVVVTMMALAAVTMIVVVVTAMAMSMAMIVRRMIVFMRGVGHEDAYRSQAGPESGFTGQACSPRLIAQKPDPR